MNNTAVKFLLSLLIVTIALTAVAIVLALRGDITGQDFLSVFLMVISFYFGTQSQKTQGGGNDAE